MVDLWCRQYITRGGAGLLWCQLVPDYRVASGLVAGFRAGCTDADVDGKPDRNPGAENARCHWGVDGAVRIDHLLDSPLHSRSGPCTDAVDHWGEYQPDWPGHAGGGCARRGAAEMRYDVSNLKQTISVSIGTFTAMMISLGLVLLSKERSESLLQQMALRDVLTGILNRRAILEQFSKDLERSRRENAYLAVAMVDIDHFKQINDVHGHLAGDEVICHCVNHLTERLRHSDSIGRYGGEEFLVLLPGTSPEGAVAVLDKLRASLAETPAQFGDASIPVRISIGVCCVMPEDGDTTASLLAWADAALYEAKGLGRNTLRLAQPRRLRSAAPFSDTPQTTEAS